MSHHVYGIRHHGPGCARSLLQALEELQPDALVIEGPPDAEDILQFVPDPEMKPPVALLVYPADEPSRAVYYPMAAFSPEWQALRFAFERGIAVYFMDLPMKHRLELEKQLLQRTLEAAAKADQSGNGEPAADNDLKGEQTDPNQNAEGGPAAEDTSETQHDENEEITLERLLREDPVGVLAMAAGYEDRELWWETQIEQRRDAAGMFQGIMEAMTELRQSLQAEPAASLPFGQSERRFEDLREAYMRQMIRKAIKQGHERIAVVCGAWHAPVLKELGPAKPDQDLLKKLPSCKTVATWIPWSYARLSLRSGYGAGVGCPGWYDHLWNDPHRPHVHWITRAARLLRTEGLDASAASVIEAIRLSETLAAIRDLPLPGLTEVSQAILTVLCNGNDVKLSLVRERLEIGDRFGAVPTSAPTVPLQQDLVAWQKRLRLKSTTEIKNIEIDLRKENDREKSRLLHRLRLLDIPWGSPTHVSGSGTFKEGWRVQWDVGFAVRIIEANVWGNTVESAATARATRQAADAPNLSELSVLLDDVILAELPVALEQVLLAFQQRVAIAADVQHLMDALVPLARGQRYQDVRKTPVERLAAVFDVLFERVLVDLPPSVQSINDEAAASIVRGMRAVQSSLTLLDANDKIEEWTTVLRTLLEPDPIHGLVRGTSCRLLFDMGRLDGDEVSRLAGLSLAPQWPPQQSAAWLEGLLAGNAMALLHEHGLWLALDRWLSNLHEEIFVEMLPLVRRSFSNFSAPERRSIGELIKNLKPGPSPHSADSKHQDLDHLDHEQAAKVLPILRQILGT